MTERPNIRRMQMPETDEAAIFDPLTDLSQNDWKNILDRFSLSRERARSSSSPFFPASLALNIYAIDPAKIVLGKDDAQTIMQMLDDRREHSPSGISTCALAFQRLSGKRLILDDNDWEKMDKYLRTLRPLTTGNFSRVWDFAALASKMHELDLGQPALSSDDWDVMIAEFGRMREMGQFGLLAGMAVHLANLDPSREWILPADWKHFRDMLRNIKKAKQLLTEADVEFIGNLSRLAQASKRSRAEKIAQAPESLQI